MKSIESKIIKVIDFKIIVKNQMSYANFIIHVLRNKIVIKYNWERTFLNHFISWCDLYF